MTDADEWCTWLRPLLREAFSQVPATAWAPACLTLSNLLEFELDRCARPKSETLTLTRPRAKSSSRTTC